MFVAVLLRTIIGFQSSPQFTFVVFLVVGWALIFVGNESLADKLPWESILLIGLEMLTILPMMLDMSVCLNPDAS
jgi:hypothetical protein